MNKYDYELYKFYMRAKARNRIPAHESFHEWKSECRDRLRRLKNIKGPIYNKMLLDHMPEIPGGSDLNDTNTPS